MKKYLAIVAVLMLAATLVVGCEGVSSATALPPGTGMLKIYVTDPPPPDMEEVLVTIKSLEIHKDGGSWETVDEDTHQFNLLDLIGIHEFLASKVVDAGRYTQIRLDIEEVKIKIELIVFCLLYNNIIVVNRINIIQNSFNFEGFRF